MYLKSIPMRGIAAIILFLLPLLLFGDETLGGLANPNWQCSGCRNEAHQTEVFGAIHQAIHKEERGIFLAIDMNWWDLVLHTYAKVKVLVVDKDKLSNMTHPTTLIDDRFNITTRKSARPVYHIIVSEVPANIHVENSHRYRRRAAYIDPPQHTSIIFTGVDEFLTRNPCFIPVAEPVRAFSSKLSNLATLGTRRRLDEIHKGKTPGLGGRLLVLLGMPSVPLHATCVLFKDITRRQFPKQCFYDQDHMSLHELSNIGYAHTIIHFSNSFVHNLFKGKVQVMPRADPFYARKILVVDPSTSNTTTSNSGWGWADPDICAEETMLHDPWACNFLPLTSCNNRFLTASLAPESLTGWSTPSKTLQAEPVMNGEGGLGITDDIRRTFLDSPILNEEMWTQSRTYAFLQRPNAYLRLLIRVSLRNIALAAGPMKDAPEMHSSLTTLLSPCVAMHIRHQDLFLEERRAKSGIFRSLDAHIKASRNMTRSLGIRRIYLATDNATIFDIVAGQSPQHSWYFQRRPVPRRMQFFTMFTNMYDTASHNFSQAEKDGLPKIPGENRDGDAARESVMATLAHILADWRAATYCSAIIGAFDSGFAAQMYRGMCAAGSGRGSGACPPSFDMRNTFGS